MAHKNVDYKPEDIQFPNQKIVQSELVHEMQSSYIEYAMSVIVGRALPDVRDGLKPVHRRILYAMYEDGLTSDKPFKKSATCVGDVLGRYHPHGDASVYDALVRLAQDFSMRYMLVDGHGNFGSIDGDPPAAYRYTEARMSKIANEMLRDIDKETVDWDPNFDESRKEPRVLPARFPNLLVNGSSGIAVGMATNIPPHNLTEVINACVCVLDNPEATLYDLMQHVTGPDFPTKGIIMGRSGIRAAYATGRGKIILRARTEFEEFGRDRTRIIVTELPYQVNKRMLIKNMADQVNDKRLEGISDIRDETDRTGMRIVIEVRHDANPQVVLNRLFAQTQLQTSFAINMLALVDNQKQPKILSLRHIIDEYLAFQEELITRRTQYDLKKAREREHLLQGLLIAQDNIDEVIHIIRTSYDDAKEKLMERFSLSDVQAQAILDMRLKALQGLDREKLQNAYKELEDRIAYYERVLGDMGLVKSILKDELTAIRDKYGDERRTEIQDVEDEIDIEDLIEEEDCCYTLSNAGYIKRLPVDTYRTQRRGGRGVSAMSTREEDFAKDIASRMKSGAADAVTDAASQLSNLAGKAKEKFDNAIAKAKSFATDLISKLKGGASDAVSNAASQLATMPQKVKEKLDLVIQKAVSFAADLKEKFTSAGKNALAGIINGISSKIEEVKTSISNVGLALINTFKTLLGIHSPSRVFAEQGGFIAAGLIIGMEGATDDVKKAAAQLAGAAVDAATDAVAEVAPTTLEKIKENLEKIEDAFDDDTGLGKIYNTIKNLFSIDWSDIDTSDILELAKNITTLFFDSLDKNVRLSISDFINTSLDYLNKAYEQRSVRGFLFLFGGEA